MWRWLLLLLLVAAVPCLCRRSPELTPADGQLLLLSSFGAALPEPNRPQARDAEGLYMADHTMAVQQWRHVERPHIQLTYGLQTNQPYRWLVRDLSLNVTAAALAAGTEPWSRHGARWKVESCAGTLHSSATLQLRSVADLRRQASCSTLAWRLVGLTEQYERLWPLAGVYRATEQYQYGAPVYTTAGGARLQHTADGARASWLLRANDSEAVQLAVLGDFSDRINWVRTEDLVASEPPALQPGHQLAFECVPAGWQSGDSDFQQPHLDGYRTTSSQPELHPWRRPLPNDADRFQYQETYGEPLLDGQQLLVFLFNTSSFRGSSIEARLESTTPLPVGGDGCALLRLRSTGFRVTVFQERDGVDTELLSSAVDRGWHDELAPLVSSGAVLLRVHEPFAANARLALQQVMVFNESCYVVRDRQSACDVVSCENGGTCISVSTKHYLCVCATGFLGERCERQVDCGPPANITGGMIIHFSGQTYLDRAYYGCLPGFMFDSPTVFGLAWSTCHHNNTWVHQPRCRRTYLVGPYIRCGFDQPCDGFNTDIDNDFNVDTDVEWSRVERLKTTDYKATTGGTFLSVSKPAGGHTVTTRLRTACPGLLQTGCVRVRYSSVNATFELSDLRSGRTIITATSNRPSSSRGLAEFATSLPASVGPLLLVVRLHHGRAEFGLDSMSLYNRPCNETEGEEEDGPLSATWSPEVVTLPSSPAPTPISSPAPTPTSSPAPSPTPDGYQNPTSPGSGSAAPPEQRLSALVLLAFTGAILCC